MWHLPGPAITRRLRGPSGPRRRFVTKTESARRTEAVIKTECALTEAPAGEACVIRTEAVLLPAYVRTEASVTAAEAARERML